MKPPPDDHNHDSELDKAQLASRQWVGSDLAVGASDADHVYASPRFMRGSKCRAWSHAGTWSNRYRKYYGQAACPRFSGTLFDCSFVIRSRNFPHRNNSNSNDIQIGRLSRPLNAPFNFRVIGV